MLQDLGLILEAALPTEESPRWYAWLWVFAIVAMLAALVIWLTW